MTSLIYIVVVLTTVILHCGAEDAPHPILPAGLDRILGPIPDDDRNEFLRYHLNRGFQIKKLREGVVYPSIQKELTTEESLQLYNYYLEYFKLEDENRVAELNNWVCFPDGCINLGDPGIFPK